MRQPVQDMTAKQGGEWVMAEFQSLRDYYSIGERMKCLHKEIAEADASGNVDPMELSAKRELFNHLDHELTHLAIERQGRRVTFH